MSKTEHVSGAMRAAGKIVDMMKGEGPIHNVNADSAFHSFASIIDEETATERDQLKESHAELVKALGQTEIILTLIFGETGEDHISNYALDCRNVTVRPAIAKAEEVQDEINTKG